MPSSSHVRAPMAERGDRSQAVGTPWDHGGVPWRPGALQRWAVRECASGDGARRCERCVLDCRMETCRSKRRTLNGAAGRTVPSSGIPFLRPSSERRSIFWTSFTFFACVPQPFACVAASKLDVEIGSTLLAAVQHTIAGLHWSQSRGGVRRSPGDPPRRRKAVIGGVRAEMKRFDITDMFGMA